MPIYEYKCKKCHKHFEKVQKITEAPISKCPSCNGKVEKLISQTSFSLKGGGWYKDGYSSSGANKSSATNSTKRSEGKKESGSKK